MGGAAPCAHRLSPWRPVIVAMMFLQCMSVDAFVLRPLSGLRTVAPAHFSSARVCGNSGSEASIKTRLQLRPTMSDTTTLAAGAFLLSNVAYVGQLAFNKPRAAADGEPYELLKGVQLYRATDQELVDVTSLWGDGDKAVMELAVTLNREVKPVLDEMGVKLVAIGIGTPSRGAEFCQHTGFPPEGLYSDPDNTAYSALKMNKGVFQTFFRPETPLALAKRWIDGRSKDLTDTLSNWKVWIPPKLDQAYLQGGMMVFHGTQAVFQHYDPSPSAHADLDEVLAAVRQPYAAGSKAATAAGSSDM